MTAEAKVKPTGGISPFDEMRYLLGKTKIIDSFNLPEFLTGKNFTVASVGIAGIDLVYFRAPLLETLNLPFPRQARFIGSTIGGSSAADHIIIVPDEIAYELQPIHAYREWLKAQMMESGGFDILDSNIYLEAVVEQRVLSVVDDRNLARCYAYHRLIDTRARIDYLDILIEAALREGNQERREMYRLDLVRDQLDRACEVLIDKINSYAESDTMQIAA
jgi:hypothetical protein